MKLYPENYIVEIDVPFTDLNGETIEPTALSAKLFGDNDTLIVDLGDIAIDGSSGKHTITIEGEHNALAPEQLRSPRILRIQLTTPKGAIPRSYTYAVEKDRRLELMKNTFISPEGAELLALEMTSASGWSIATQERRIAALAESYKRLTSIAMRFNRYGDLTSLHSFNTIAQAAPEEVILTREVWATVTAEDFEAFPADFKNALRRAQLIDANEILQGDTIAKKHRAGIASETVGESSVTLRGGRIEYGLSSEALRVLSGYIYNNVRVARA